MFKWLILLALRGMVIVLVDSSRLRTRVPTAEGLLSFGVRTRVV